MLVSAMQQNESAINPLFSGFLRHLGHHRALSRVPYTIQWVLINYLFWTLYQQFACVNPHLPVHPTSLLGIHTCLFPLSVSHFCFVNKVISTIFLDSTYMH